MSSDQEQAGGRRTRARGPRAGGDRPEPRRIQDDDDRAEYFGLLNQPGLTTQLSACLLYPCSPNEQESASQGGNDKWDDILNRIQRAVANNTVISHRVGRAIYVNQASLIKWAYRTKLISRPLNLALLNRLREIQGTHGRHDQAREADIEILGAGLAVLAEKVSESADKAYQAPEIVELITRNAEAFWPDTGYPPKSDLERLISPFQTKLRNFRRKQALEAAPRQKKRKRDQSTDF